MADNPFEIPQTLRDVSEQNLKQAHAAYEQLTDFVTKAIDAWMEAMPASYMVTGFKDVRDRASEIAKKNAGSAFALIEKIAKAQNFQEIVTLQTRFAQDQMQAYATEMQELQRLMGETLQKLQRGSPS
ncbi:MAG: phasin family protein [Rhodomicrobium sp.]